MYKLSCYLCYLRFYTHSHALSAFVLRRNNRTAVPYQIPKVEIMMGNHPNSGHSVSAACVIMTGGEDVTAAAAAAAGRHRHRPLVMLKDCVISALDDDVFVNKAKQSPVFPADAPSLPLSLTTDIATTKTTCTTTATATTTTTVISSDITDGHNNSHNDDDDDDDDANIGLSNVPLETLQLCVEPILQGLRQIDAQALLNLVIVQKKQNDDGGGTTVAGGGARLNDGVYVEPIHDKIEPACDDDDDTSSSSVRYLHLSEAPGKYSMGIFIFPPHAMIPLHDHPGMCVLSRVLYGDLDRLSLDLVRTRTTKESTLSSLQEQQHSQKTLSSTNGGDPWNMMAWSPSPEATSTTSANTNTNNMPSSQRHHHQYRSQLPPPPPQLAIIPPIPKHLPAGTQYARRRKNHHNVDHFHAPDVTVLYPFEGNLHQFVAGPHGAAVLDVLLPPYDVNHDRDCTFYQIINILNKDDDYYAKSHVDQHDVDDDMEHDDDDNDNNTDHDDDDDDDHDMDDSNNDDNENPSSSSLPYLEHHGNSNYHHSNHHGQQPQHQQQQQTIVEDNNDDNKNVDPDLCLIVPTGQPEDFHCLSGRYRDIGSIPS